MFVAALRSRPRAVPQIGHRHGLPVIFSSLLTNLQKLLKGLSPPEHAFGELRLLDKHVTKNLWIRVIVTVVFLFYGIDFL